MPILAANDTGTETVSAYLDRPLYYAQRRGMGTFVRWDLSRLIFGHDKELGVLQDYLETHPARCLIVLNFGTPRPTFPRRTARLVASFTDALDFEENHWVYEISAAAPNLHELWQTHEPQAASP